MVKVFSILLLFIGVELNLPLVLWSKANSRRKGLSSLCRFYRKNIFKADLTPYNVAILFAAETMVEHLIPKLCELRPKSHLIMCRFPLPTNNENWELLEAEGDGIDTAWLYRKCT